MNDQPNPAEFALAMYATACESHMRRDWREACHALAKALKAEQLASASRAVIATAAPMPDPVATAPDSPVKAKPAAKAPRVAKGAESFDMTAGSLAKALRLVCAVAPKQFGPLNDAAGKKRAPHILTFAKLEAAGDTITLTGADMGRQIRVEVSAPGAGQWIATASAHGLKESLAKADKAAPVTFEALDGDKLAVTIGGARVTFNGRAPADFPDAPGEPDARAGEGGAKWIPVDIDGAAFVGALQFTAPAMSREATRYYLNGVYAHVFEQGGKREMGIVSTDGHRAHIARIAPPLKTSEPDAPGVIIPFDTVKLALATMDDGAGLTVAWDARFILLERGAVRITSRLIDGSFPDYFRIIPRASDLKFTAAVQSDQLASAARSVSAVTSAKGPGLYLTLAGDALTATCRDSESGNESAETIQAALDRGCVADWPVSLGLDVRYLTQCLESLASDRVSFGAESFAGEKPGGEPLTADAVRLVDAPLLFTGADPSRLVVLMPRRV